MADEPKKEETKTKEPVEEKKSNGSTKEQAYYEAVGRRREASARVRLYVIPGESVKVKDMTLTKGSFMVNGRKVEDYFPGDVYKQRYQEPLRTTNTIGRFGVSVQTVGGGLVGQLGATVHGLARALEKVDHDKFRPILKKRGFLTRDARIRERRKAGLGGRARAKKQSPKR